MDELPDIFRDDLKLPPPKSHREKLERDIKRAMWAEVSEKWENRSAALREREVRAKVKLEWLRELLDDLDWYEAAAAIGDDATSSLFPDSEAKGRG